MAFYDFLALRKNQPQMNQGRREKREDGTVQSQKSPMGGLRVEHRDAVDADEKAEEKEGPADGRVRSEDEHQRAKEQVRKPDQQRNTKRGEEVFPGKPHGGD